MLKLTVDLPCAKDIIGTCKTGRLYGRMDHNYEIFTTLMSSKIVFDSY